MHTPHAPFLRSLLVSLAMATSALSVQAADAFTDAVSLAYAPYRSALFRTNSQAQAESEQAIAQARAAWDEVRQRFGAQPPAPYDRDAQFAQTLQSVDSVYRQASEEIAKQQLTKAHETLESVRDLLAEQRQRNGVVVFSDHVNAYHAAMEHTLTSGPALLAQTDGALHMMAQVGVLQHLAQRLRQQAPATLLQQPAFTELLGALETSVTNLRSATLQQDVSAMRSALGQLKATFSRLFLRFG
jgi:hypothetical protein